MNIKNYMLDIINILNAGGTVSATDYASQNNLHRRTIVNYIKNIKDSFNLTSITNQHGTWSAGKGGFLKYLGLTPEEMVVLIDLYNTSTSSSMHLDNALQDIISNYKNSKKINHLYTDKEKVSTSMSVIIKTIEEAIRENKKILLLFNKHYRIIQPFKVFSREYYWYFAGFEEDKYEQTNNQNRSITNNMKTYTISSIRSIRILDEQSITYDFSNAENVLQNSINGYMTWENHPRNVELLIHKKLAGNIERAGVYKNWIKINESSVHQGYILFKLKSVHREFKDIIPTIIKHSPEIIVYEPEELAKAVQEQKDKIYIL